MLNNIFIFSQSDAGWEEYFDYIFPEDEATKPNLKLLAMAKAWKMAKESAPANQEEETPKSNAPLVDIAVTSMSSSSLSTQQLLSQDDDRDDSSESSDSDSGDEKKDQSNDYFHGKYTFLKSLKYSCTYVFFQLEIKFDK